MCVISLVNIGEETGALDTMLDKVADFYGAEVDDTIGRLQTIMDPILIVVLGVIIGTPVSYTHLTLPTNSRV